MTNHQHIAEQMYAAYCQQAGGLTFDGKPLPSFQELGLERQTCWKAAAAAAHEQYAQPAAPVVLPEPDSYLFQHEDTGQTMFVDAQQVEWGFEANNPRLHKVSGLYTEQQVRELLAAHGITQKKAKQRQGETTMAITTGAEHAALYREFCEWGNTVPYLDLDPRLHTHGGRIEDGGYISDIATAKAFAAWQAARRATAAPQPQADARDAERWSEIGKSIERACGELPEDFEITIHLENGAGTVVLLYPNGEECENFPHDDGFAGVVNAAIDAAIAAAKEK